MEVGHVIGVSAPDADGIVSVAFEIQTLEGALETEAAVPRDSKFTAGSAHYILLSADKGKCTVL